MGKLDLPILPETREKVRVATAALFFPFDLFGSAGASAGVELLADAFRELVADNRREQVATRALAYQGKVRIREFTFETLPAYETWHSRAAQAIRRVLRRRELLIWTTGNHLGVLPLYDEFSALGRNSLVVQLDAHLDIYSLSDCTAEPSHGNFLLHSKRPLPRIINLGTRELLLRPDYIKEYYHQVFPAAALAIDPNPALKQINRASLKAERVFLDIDCDVFDPAYFSAVTHPLPFGLSPAFVLRVVDAIWSERVAGIALSEFDPARDRDDQSLSTLVWLLEYLLLKKYECGSLCD
jgi:arginase family enzyme